MALPTDTVIDVKAILIADAVAVSNNSLAWSCHIGREPANPNRVITLYLGAGIEPNPKFLLETNNFQIRTRSNPYDYPGAFARHQLIKDALLGRDPVTQGNSNYRGFWMNTDILFLKYDDNNRPIFVSNWRTTREPTNSTTESNRQAL